MFSLSLYVGTARVEFFELWGSFLFPSSNAEKIRLIVFENRLPRSLTAVLSGAGLALAGVVTQVCTRNPLASPFTLGISSAAGFGAALAIVTGGGGVLGVYLGGFEVTNAFLVIALAFLFSLLAVAAIFATIRWRGATPETIILIGVAMFFLFSAATSFAQYFGTTEQVAAIVFWLFGSLSKATWFSFWIILTIFTFSFPIIYGWCWRFNAISLGDEFAKGLGVNVERLRTISIVVVSLITSVIVSFLGVISFVCLVSPHIARLVIGGDHKYLIPSSCLVGANILLTADIASRSLFQPLILPVGILTSFLGVPLLVYLLLRRRGEYW